MLAENEKARGIAPLGLSVSPKLTPQDCAHDTTAVEDVRNRILRDTADVPRVTSICAVCGLDVSRWRADAVYCSGACRQRAYRARKAAAS